MQFKLIRPKFWPFGLRGAESAVLRDAGELIETWGKLAYSIAETLSWREDIGLVHTASLGHWSRVKREIGFRLEKQDIEPKLDRAA